MLVEKRKWDGSVASQEDAQLLVDSEQALVWVVWKGTPRSRPKKSRSETVERDEVWVALPDEPVVAVGYSADSDVETVELHAALPPRRTNDGLSWVDLDLDVVAKEGGISLEDERAFVDNAQAMAYPDDVIRAAWHGVSEGASRLLMHEWPFDGWLTRQLAVARESVTQV